MTEAELCCLIDRPHSYDMYFGAIIPYTSGLRGGVDREQAVRRIVRFLEQPRAAEAAESAAAGSAHERWETICDRESDDVDRPEWEVRAVDYWAIVLEKVAGVESLQSEYIYAGQPLPERDRRIQALVRRVREQYSF